MKKTKRKRKKEKKILLFEILKKIKFSPERIRLEEAKTRER